MNGAGAFATAYPSEWNTPNQTNPVAVGNDVFVIVPNAGDLIQTGTIALKVNFAGASY